MPRQSRQHTLVGGLIAALASACSPYLHSPPARLVPLEAAKALAKGDLAFQGALGGGTSVWRPGYIAGTFETPRSALIIAYRFVGAAYDEAPFGRVHEIYHLGVFALDFVLRRNGSEGSRWKLR